MFKDRKEAGVILAEKLKEYKNKKGVCVLGIPRGGVVVAKELSKILKLPFDLIIIRKISSPNNPELAIGGVGPNKTAYWDEDLCDKLRITEEIKSLQFSIANKERERREKILMKGRKHIDVKGKTLILVDDGIATGATIICAQKYLRKVVSKLILATPVISKDTYRNIVRYFDKIVGIAIEDDFQAVGQFYSSFPQVTDKEVVNIL